MQHKDRMLPADEHNKVLLDHVRPADWPEIKGEAFYDAVVIGAGAAGLVSGSICAGLGARVALIERNLLGGDCLNTGCVPSKALISSARKVDAARRMSWLESTPDLNADAAQALTRMRRLRSRIAPHDSAAGLRDKGVDVFFGDATFSGPDRIQINGRELKFRRAFIATGGRPVVPPIPGLDEVPVYTSDNIFTLEKLPKRLLVVGGGPIGSELAQTFSLLGSQVTQVEAAPRILLRDDPDGSAAVQKALQESGVEVLCDTKLVSFRKTDAGSEAQLLRNGKNETRVIDGVLLAVGRKANAASLNCEQANVKLGQRGEVIVDEFLRTSNSRIYALGDVIGSWQFTHAADAMARAAVSNAFFFGRTRHTALKIPWATYTTPELAGVGMDLAQAREQGLDAEELVISFSGLDRSILEEGEGFLKVIHTAKGKVLGFRILAENAGDLLATAVVILHSGVTMGKLSGMVFPYPTHGEVFRQAGDQWRRRLLKPWVARLLKRIIKSR